MITMRDFKVAEERRKDLLREAETERLLGKNQSLLQLKLQHLLVQFGDAMQAKFTDAKSKSTMEKSDPGRLAHDHR